MQRFAMMIVMIQKAEVYIFDEPTSYLDVKQRIKMAKLQRLSNFGYESGSFPVVAHFIIEQLPDCSFKFGSDGLRLIADVHLWNLRNLKNTSYLLSSFSFCSCFAFFSFFPASANILMKVVLPVPF